MDLKHNINVVNFYTDGSCSRETKKGGWGVVFVDNNGNEKRYYGGARNTTNNQMELMGIIFAMEYAIKNGLNNVNIYSDSQYSVFSINHYMDMWIGNGMVKSDGDPVKNQELFYLIYELKKELSFNLRWVKGHSDNYYNNLADILATKYWDVCNEIYCSPAEVVYNPCRPYVLIDTHNRT